MIQDVIVRVVPVHLLPSVQVISNSCAFVTYEASEACLCLVLQADYSVWYDSVGGGELTWNVGPVSYFHRQRQA